MDEEEEEELVYGPYKNVLKTSTLISKQLKLPVLSALWHLQEMEKEGVAWLRTSTLLLTSTT